MRSGSARDLRRGLLRLIDGIIAALYLSLLRVLAALSRDPPACDHALALLAASRRFGDRGSPDDHDAFPALMPMPVVIGGSARST